MASDPVATVPRDSVAMTVPEQLEAFEERRVDAASDEAQRLRRAIAFLLVVVVVVVVVLFAVPGLEDVAARLGDVGPGWLVLAVALKVVSVTGFVLAFRLVFSRVPRVLAVRVALSELAFTAVLPAGGAGGIALGAWITKVKGGSVGRFMRRSAVLFLLMSWNNVATLALAGLLVGVGILEAPHHIGLGLVPGLGALAICVTLWYVPSLAGRSQGSERPGRIARWLRESRDVVGAAKWEILHPNWRLLGVIAYLWADIAMLWVSFRAFGEAPPVGALALAFIIGQLANIVPVPGGVGVLDGGLVAALILFGADAASAAAAVLLYHAIWLWVPTLIGTIAFLRLRRTIHEPVVLLPEDAHLRAAERAADARAKAG